MKNSQITNAAGEQNRHRITSEEIQHHYNGFWDNEIAQAETTLQMSVKQPILHEHMERWAEDTLYCSLIQAAQLTALIAWKAFDSAFPQLPPVSSHDINIASEELAACVDPTTLHQHEAMQMLFNIVCEEEHEAGCLHSEDDIDTAFFNSVAVITMSLDMAAAKLQGDTVPVMRRPESKCSKTKKAKREPATDRGE